VSLTMTGAMVWRREGHPSQVARNGDLDDAVDPRGERGIAVDTTMESLKPPSW
jgi:hypothetical protein